MEPEDKNVEVQGAESGKTEAPSKGISRRNKPPTEMVIFIGLPRSGKSTYVDRYFQDYQIICPDDIRQGLGVRHDPRLEPFVWAVAEAQARAILHRRRPLVVDATNTTEQARSKWMNLAGEYQYPLRMIWVDTPPEICLKRARKDRFPESVLLRMQNQLERSPPTEGEGYRLEVIKTGRQKRN